MVFSLILSGYIIGVLILYYEASSENARLADMAKKIADRASKGVRHE